MHESVPTYGSATAIKLPTKGIKGHAAGLCKHWNVFVGTFTATLASAIGLIEIATKLSGASPSYAAIGPYLLLVCGVIATWRVVFVYAKDLPQSISQEGAEVRSIYFRQARGWQFRLAEKLLEKHVLPLDSELGRIEDGSKYVPTRHLELQEYVKWLRVRPDNLQRLLRAACKTMIERLPNALRGEKGSPQLHDIVATTSQMAELYKDCVLFEEDARAIVPPAGLEALHATSLGWTEPLRKGMKELMGFLRKAGAVKYGTVEKLTLDLQFDPPPQVERFCEELKRLPVDSQPF